MALSKAKSRSALQSHFWQCEPCELLETRSSSHDASGSKLGFCLSSKLSTQLERTTSWSKLTASKMRLLQWPFGFDVLPFCFCCHTMSRWYSVITFALICSWNLSRLCLAVLFGLLCFCFVCVVCFGFAFAFGLWWLRDGLDFVQVRYQFTLEALNLQAAMYALITSFTLVCNMQLNVLDDLAEAMKALDGKQWPFWQTGGFNKPQCSGKSTEWQDPGEHGCWLKVSSPACMLPIFWPKHHVVWNCLGVVVAGFGSMTWVRCWFRCDIAGRMLSSAFALAVDRFVTIGRHTAQFCFGLLMLCLFLGSLFAPLES